VWLAALDPTRGREQAGTRPVVVVSSDAFNRGPGDLVVALPVTTHERRVKLHVPVDAGEGGLLFRSVILCDNLRSVSKERLIRRFGAISPATMEAVEDRLRVLLSL
jgi:mRNA interferase MazF